MKQYARTHLMLVKRNEDLPILRFRIFVVVCLVGMLCCIRMPIVYAESLVQVVEMVWTGEISDTKSPVQRYENNTTPKGNALCMWTTLRGGQPALEHLKQQGKITIVHKWRYKKFRWKTERINVSIGRDAPLDAATLQKLAYEIEAQGYFDWRTWSKKTHVIPITYTVTVVDGFDDPIACEVGTTCEREITVIE